MSILKQVNSYANFSSFFIVMTHNSPVNFKLMHFLLWIKGSHQSPSFDTFEYYGKNLPNSCHFTNQKSVFLQIFHHSSVSWNITLLYFFRSNVIYFAQKEPVKVEILRILSAQVKIHQIFVTFESTIQILHQPSVSWDITPLYFFSWNFIYIQQKEPIKIEIWWNFMWEVESLKFCTLIGSFCPSHMKFQLKKYRIVTSHDTEE